jgi:hypothetical protein
MLGLAAWLEGLDDDHAGAAARAWTGQHAGLVGGGGLGRLVFFWAGRHREQLARVRNVCGARAVGEQPIVPDAMEALRQHVDRRNIVLGQCWQLNQDMDSYSERHCPAEPIQIDFNFNIDLEELEQIPDVA